MKKKYQYPETEIVFVGLSKLIMAGDEGAGSGVIGNEGAMTNENVVFEEDIETHSTSSNLWD